ncbi:MAG: hypothetical protein WC494_03330 [Candidatus Pacearchaeota archaeon]
MNKFLELLIGLIFLLVPIYAWIVNFWGVGDSALVFFKGGLVWMLILIGVVFILIGISDLKN